MPVTKSEAENKLLMIPEWKLSDDAKSITRTIKFSNFADSLAYVNRVGELCEQNNHHADFEFGWGYCRMTLTTHDAGGLMENDFAMAIKINSVRAQ